MRCKRKWWALIAAMAVLTVGLAACGQTKTTRKNSEKRITITYWHRMTGTWEKAQQDLIDKFNQSQAKYKVVATSQGSYDALQQKIMAAAKSKTLPTMAQAPYTNLGDYVANDFLMPWDDQMLSGQNKLTAKQLDDIYPGMLAAGKYKGKYYGLPYAISTRVLFYNQGLIDQYHLELPNKWEQIEAMGPKLKAVGLTTIALDASYDVELEDMAQQSGHPLVTEKGVANLDAPTTLKAVERLLALRSQGFLTTAGQDKYFSAAFMNGKAVFGIASSASIPVLQQQAPKDMKWGTTVIPGVDVQFGTALTGNDNVLFKGASKDQQEGAWAFQKFLLKPENTAYWAEKSGYVPVTRSGVKSARYQKFLQENPQFQAAVDAARDSFASAVFAGYGDYRNALLDTVDATLTKGTPGPEAFGALQTKTETILKQQK